MSSHSLHVERIKKDHLISLIVASSFFLFIGLLLYFTITFIPLPPVANQMMNEDAELEIVEVEYIPVNLDGGGGGGGTPADAPQNDKFIEQSQQYLSEEGSKTPSNSGSSSITNSKKPTSNKPSTVQSTKNPNPFGTDGGGPNGKGGRKGGGIGKDSGPGDGPGPPGKGTKGSGGIAERKIISFPNTNNIQNDEECVITFRLIVDENGELVGNPTLVGGTATTTNNSSLIEQVKAAVKSQLRYNSVKGADRFNTKITLRILAR